LSYTAKDWIADCLSNNLALDDQLLNYICPTDKVGLNVLLRRLKFVRDLDPKIIAPARKAQNKTAGPRKHVYVSVGSVQGVRSSITGRILERIIRLLFKSCQAVQSVANLRSSTAEIDLLLHLNVLSGAVPMFRTAGTHIIGEAKCYASGFKQEWVNELCGLMAQHNCSHSILFVGSPSKVLKIDHRHGLHVHAIRGQHVVPFGIKQFEEVAAGENFLKVLGRQFVDVQVSSVSLAI
jgi:hypothetical protein